MVDGALELETRVDAGRLTRLVTEIFEECEMGSVDAALLADSLVSADLGASTRTESCAFRSTWGAYGGAKLIRRGDRESFGTLALAWSLMAKTAWARSARRLRWTPRSTEQVRPGSRPPRFAGATIAGPWPIT